jgi:hypothetical protein
VVESEPVVEPDLVVEPEPAVEPDPVVEPEPAVEPALELGSVACIATGSESIATDKADYGPGETVSITGTGFAASCNVVMRVTRPDGSVVTGNGSYTPGSDTVETSPTGAFVYDYILDGIEGEYVVDALGADNVVLASTGFTDAFAVNSLVAPAWVPAIGASRFTFVFTTPSTSIPPGPTALGCVKITLPAAYGSIVAPAEPITATPGKTWTASVASQVVTFKGSAATDTLAIGEWARLALDATPSGVSTADWTVNHYSAFDCSGAPLTQAFKIRAGTSFTTYTPAFVNAGGTAITPSFPLGTTGVQTFRIRFTQTSLLVTTRGNTGNLVLPRCISNITLGALSGKGSNAFLYDNAIRVAMTASLGMGDTATGLDAVGEYAQLEFTADVSGCGFGTNPTPTAVDHSGSANTTNGTGNQWVPDSQPFFTITRGVTSVTTQVHGPDHGNWTDGSAPLGLLNAHDQATVHGQVGSVLLVYTNASMTFRFWDQAGCPAEQFIDEDVVMPMTSATVESPPTGLLLPGNYSYRALYSGNDRYLPSVGPCENFSVAKGETSVTTWVHGPDHGNWTDKSAPLGLLYAHDKATVNGQVDAIPVYEDATVEFRFWDEAGCPVEQFIATQTVPMGPSATVESAATVILPAGSYAYRAIYSGNDNYNLSVGPCENFSVAKGNTSVTTQVHGPDHGDWTGKAAPEGYLYAHDQATVSGQVNPFPVYEDATVEFRFWDQGGCPIEEFIDSEIVPMGSSATVESAATGLLPPGNYSYRAIYSGNDNYNLSVGPCESFAVVPDEPVVTSSSLCTFDVDPDLNGDQFRLIFTPDGAMTYSKLNASNPGQFFVNVFTLNDSVTINIPPPFVTQGANPVHVYSGVTMTTNEEMCFTPGPAKYGYSVTGSPITGTGGGTVTVSGLGDTFSYIAIHLDYGKKGTTEYTPGASSDPDHPNAIKVGGNINNNTAHVFTANGLSSIVYNQNVFKKDPGIGSLVYTRAGDPVIGTPVEVWKGTTKLATLQTDEDGWSMWLYKHTGKAATYTVKLPEFKMTQSLTVRANGFLIVRFDT